MSLRINHNVSAINSHRNLQANQSEMSKTLERLSSGLKINRASEGPASLVISEQMRAQIAGLNQAIDNSEMAVSLVQTAEANMNEISNLLTSVRQLAIHAANEGVNDEVMLEADQKEIENALATIDRISNQAQFGTKRLLDGSRGAAGTTTGTNLEFVGATLESGDSRENGFDVKITGVATKASISGTTALAAEAIKAGEQLSVIEDGKLASYTSNADDTVETVIQNLKSDIERNGLQVDISLNAETGMIDLQHKEYGSGHQFQAISNTAGVLSAVGDEIFNAQDGTNISGTINGESAVGLGQVLTGVKGAACVDGLAVRYYGDGKDLLEPDCVVADLPAKEGEVAPEPKMVIPPEGASVGRVYVAQNSMKFQVGANHNQTVGISVKSTNPETLARGIDNRTGYENLSQIDVRNFQSAQDAILMVDAAIAEVTSSRGEIGAFQKNTLESNLSNIRIANENLISSESVIRDVDMAKEMASFTRNQIMTQSATAMLAQANQLPQNVLQLLG
ncbi:MAG: flagellin [Deltaproteobacteria bacterium]|jgi:flagellin|nr:flagellin [Deltaproteobacteria bacterium]MBT7154010.1 flagellin [Deltaproteobacteria bacterium]